MNVFIEYINFIYWKYQRNHFIYYFVVIILYKKNSHETMDARKYGKIYGLGYEIKFHI